MPNANIEAGDTVKLKSGSPLMTVAFVRDGVAHVNWYENGEIKHANIQILSLTKED